MAKSLQDKVDNGDIDKQELENAGKDMMNMISKLSTVLAPALGNMMQNGNDSDADTDNPFNLSSLFSSLVGGGDNLSNNEKKDIRSNVRRNKMKRRLRRKYEREQRKKLSKKPKPKQK